MSDIYIIITVLLAFICGGTWEVLHANFNKLYLMELDDSSLTGLHICNSLLKTYGKKQIKVKEIDGILVDGYNKKDNILYFTRNTYNSSSYASLIIACFECRRAIFENERIGYVNLLRTIDGIMRTCAIVAWPLLIVGILICTFYPIIDILLIGYGIIIFTMFLQLIEMPILLNIVKGCTTDIKEIKKNDNKEQKKLQKILIIYCLKSFSNSYNYISNFIRVVVLGKHKEIKNDVKYRYIDNEKENEKSEPRSIEQCSCLIDLEENELDESDEAENINENNVFEDVKGPDEAENKPVKLSERKRRTYGGYEKQ